MNSEKWFRIDGLDRTNEPVQIYFYKEIGFQNFENGKICSEEFCKEMDSIPKEREIVIRMNSCGGSFLDGLAIANKISERGNVTCMVDGNCASASSIVAMACKKVVASEGASFVIHNARGTVSDREANDLINLAGTLNDVSDKMANIYARKSGKPVAEIKSIMNEGKRLTASDAFKLGLVDEIKKLEPKVFFPEPARINSCEHPGKNGNIMTEEEKKAAQEAARKAEIAAKDSGDNAQKQAELLARATEAESRYKEAQDLAKKQQDELNKMRLERITAEVNTACSQNKIKNTDVQGWIESCMKDPSMKARLDALPALKADPVEGGNITAKEGNKGVERIGSDTIAEISAHTDQIEGPDLSDYYAKNEAVIRAALLEESEEALRLKGNKRFKITGAITVPDNVKLAYVHEKMLWKFNRKNGRIAKVCSTQFDALPMLKGQSKIVFQVMPVSTETVQTYTEANGYSDGGNRATTSVEVEITERKFVPLKYTSEEVSRQPLLKIEGHLIRNAEKLSDYVFDDIMSHITPTNYTNVPNDLKVAKNVFDYTHVAKLQAYLDDLNWPTGNRSLILNGEYNLGLMLNSGEALLSSSNTGKESPVATGKIFTPWGFDYYEYNKNVPSNSVNLYGFAVVGDALLFASAPIIPAQGAEQVISYHVSQTNDNTCPLVFRKWFDPKFDKMLEIIEVSYGIGVGDADALVPLVSA